MGKLAEAADVISKSPIALQLRNLQVLAEIAVEKNSTIIFPAQFFESTRRAFEFLDREQGEVVRDTEPPVPAVGRERNGELAFP